jgi:hypothetical protein
MSPSDVLRQAAEILDRCSRAVVQTLVLGGVRLPPAAIEQIRDAIGTAVSEAVALGERYAHERRTSRPPPAGDREDTTSTRPGFLHRKR